MMDNTQELLLVSKLWQAMKRHDLGGFDMVRFVKNKDYAENTLNQAIASHSVDILSIVTELLSSDRFISSEPEKEVAGKPEQNIVKPAESRYIGRLR